MQLILILREGKNHQVKKRMEAFGCQVRKLHRSRFGHLSLEGMRPGEYKKLKSYDVKKLMAAAREGNEE